MADEDRYNEGYQEGRTTGYDMGYDEGRESCQSELSGLETELEDCKNKLDELGQAVERAWDLV